MIGEGSFEKLSYFLHLTLLLLRCILCTCSGYGIAAMALTSVIRAYDGRGPQTKLTSSILQELKLSSPDELIGYMFLESLYDKDRILWF